jgi:methyltransferase (TIGR00027 family)
MAEAPIITHVSDTARWVAAYRAAESARPDALFRDPYAARLAGPQGQAIAKSARTSMSNGWPIIARTKLIDDLVLKSIADGCDRVLNLAAGLDTRPYRLDLPADLAWIEADLPAMVDDKDAFFAAEKARCVLSREKVDLADGAARAAFLERATRDAKKVLVITEGLLIYLEEPVVAGLARELAGYPGVAWWILDLAAPPIKQMMSKRMSFDNAPLHFAPAEGVAYFEERGWKVLEVEPMLHRARGMKRLPLFLNIVATVLPVPNPRKVGRAMWSGIVRLAPRGGAS